MTIRYFHYISESKVAMLESQIPSMQPRLPDISPKIEIAGFSISANIKWQQGDSLVQKTITVANQLRQKHLAKALAEEHEIENTGLGLYHDVSEWHHGLVSFSDDGDSAYILSKYWNNSIILLAGSPVHIFGTFKIPEPEDKFPRATPDIIETILSHSILPVVDKDGGMCRVYNRIQPTELPIVMDRGPDQEMRSYIYSHSKEVELLALAWLYARYFSRLPIMKLDTVFAIYKSIRFQRRQDLPVWISMLNSLPTAQTEKIEKCGSIHIGSPICVAYA